MTSMNIIELPWHAAFPSPRKQEPGAMTRGEVLKMMKDSGSEAGKDYLLVDLRRTDHQVCVSASGKSACFCTDEDRI